MASNGAPDIVLITFIFTTLVIYMGLATDYQSQPIMWGAAGLILVPFYLILSLATSQFAILLVPILVVLFFRENLIPAIADKLGEGGLALVFLATAALWVGA